MSSPLPCVSSIFGNARYRLMAVPAFALFAGVAVEWIVRYRRRLSRSALAVLMLAAGTYVVYVPLIAGDEPSVAAYNLAAAYDYRGQSELAIEEYERALSLNPLNTAARYKLGVLYWNARRVDEAEVQFLEVLKVRTGDVATLNMMGNLRMYRGDTRGALEYWERSLALQPEQPAVRMAIEHNNLR